MNGPKRLSRQQVRDVDQVAIERYGMSGLVLMENAGREAAGWIARTFSPRDVCILCGKGNNGGDGYVIARHLEIEFDRRAGDGPQVNGPEASTQGQRVRIVSVVPTDRLAGDAAINHRIAMLSEIPITIATDEPSLAEAIGTADLVIDCLLGTGASGAPAGAYALAIRLANRLDAARVAIDLPSGLGCDNGQPSDPTFRADHTLTFVAAKLGFDNPVAAGWIGQVVVLPIGVPRHLLRSL